MNTRRNIRLDQAPGQARNVKLRTMGLLRGAISAAFLAASATLWRKDSSVYAIDDFLQGQVRHNELQSQDLTSFFPPRLDRNTVDYRVLIRPLRDAAAKGFSTGKSLLDPFPVNAPIPTAVPLGFALSIG